MLTYPQDTCREEERYYYVEEEGVKCNENPTRNHFYRASAMKHGGSSFNDQHRHTNGYYGNNYAESFKDDQVKMYKKDQEYKNGGRDERSGRGGYYETNNNVNNYRESFKDDQVKMYKKEGYQNGGWDERSGHGGYYETNNANDYRENGSRYEKEDWSKNQGWKDDKHSSGTTNPVNLVMGAVVKESLDYFEGKPRKPVWNSRAIFD